MKGFICFVACIAIYLILGIIVWNIVCSIIDIGPKTLIEVSDYRLYTYTAIAGLFSLAVIYMFSKSTSGERDKMKTFVLIALGINVGIALLVNHWEGAWEVVSLIFAILYNLVNIIVMTIMMRTAID